MSHDEGRRALVAEIAAIATLRGQFKLRSGATASTYFDKYLFESNPRILQPLAKLMARKLPNSTEVLAGLELGGVPLATAISLHTGLPIVFVRKAAKGYGTEKAVEGPSITSKKVTIIEDVVTTGGAIIDAVEKLRGSRAHVDTVVCAIWRGIDLSTLERHDLELRWVIDSAELDGAL